MWPRPAKAWPGQDSQLPVREHIRHGAPNVGCVWPEKITKTSLNTAYISLYHLDFLFIFKNNNFLKKLSKTATCGTVQGTMMLSVFLLKTHLDQTTSTPLDPKQTWLFCLRKYPQECQFLNVLWQNLRHDVYLINVKELRYYHYFPSKILSIPSNFSFFSHTTTNHVLSGFFVLCVCVCFA